MKNEVWENSLAKIWFEQEIMFCFFKPDVIGITEAKACVDFRLSVAKSNSYPTVINMSNVKSMTKEARDYFATEAGYQNITVSALIIHSQVSKIIGNFFLAINKPPVPIKLFNDPQEAVTWLNSKIK